MINQTKKLNFSSDYLEGAHPSILNKLAQTNMEQTPGYGTDCYTEAAKDKIRVACACPDAEIYFLTGGTQTNATVIDAFLQSYQGVIAADTGHISTHEAGAIEFGGHKVLPLVHDNGKITAEQVRSYLFDFHHDLNHEHMVMPGMVYLSQPTEYGTLYSLEELKAISAVCKDNHIPLYVDGARLAYALASAKNDVTLEDLAALCDAFYIGGTKCGALFGEAVVFPKPHTIPHFFTIIKQHGALMAKGRMLGIQFSELFTNNLYEALGRTAVQYAAQIDQTLASLGYQTLLATETNQIFCILPNSQIDAFSKLVDYGFWDKYDENHTIIRLATSWATSEAAVNNLKQILSDFADTAQ